MITSDLWNWDGTLDRIHHALYLKCREKAAREASPTGLHSSTAGGVKSAEKGGLASTAIELMPAFADQGQEAACSGRYARLAAARHRHRRRRFRIATAVSRCWRPCSVCFPFSGHPVRRQRLSGARSITAPWPASCPTAIHSRPRSSSEYPIGEGLRRPAQALGGRGRRTIAWLNATCRRLAKDWENLNRNALAFNQARVHSISCPPAGVLSIRHHVGGTFRPGHR